MKATVEDGHEPTTARDARLFRKGPGHEAKLCYMGHGLAAAAEVTRASGTAERDTAIVLLERVHVEPKRA